MWSTKTPYLPSLWQNVFSSLMLTLLTLVPSVFSINSFPKQNESCPSTLGPLMKLSRKYLYSTENFEGLSPHHKPTSTILPVVRFQCTSMVIKKVSCIFGDTKDYSPSDSFIINLLSQKSTIEDYLGSCIQSSLTRSPQQKRNSGGIPEASITTEEDTSKLRILQQVRYPRDIQI